MTSTPLFDGYLPGTEHSSSSPRRPSLTQRRTDSLASVSVDDTPTSSSGHSPTSSMTSVGRMRLGPEGEQQSLPRSPRPLDAMPEEDEQRGDDDHTLVGSEHDEPASSRGNRPRSGSALPTPTPSTITFSDSSSTPTQTPTPTRSTSQRLQQQQQQQSSSSLQPPAITFRKASTSIPSGARMRSTPRLPNHVADPAPSTIMYWSRAPVYGHLPHRAMRAHTVTLIENLAWQIGGCDHVTCSRDVLTFDTETMQWAHPETVGDVPPPCRAHSATQVDRRIFVFGGGEGPMYYNHLYVLDTSMRRWTKISHPPQYPQPIPRRAHATWYYQGKVYLFGGGNGTKALNDLWTLDVSVPYDRMRWEALEVRSTKPRPRGYHTANLIGESVVVIGGSDGSLCFEDVWVLSLEKLTWHEIKPDTPTKRLSHSSTQVGSYLFVMGGHDGSKYNHDLLLFNLVTLQWEPRETRGKNPSSRGYHATVLADSRLFVVGGFDGHNCFDDVFILDLAAAAYLPQVTSFNLTIN